MATTSTNATIPALRSLDLTIQTVWQPRTVVYMSGGQVRLVPPAEPLDWTIQQERVSSLSRYLTKRVYVHQVTGQGKESEQQQGA